MPRLMSLFGIAAMLILARMLGRRGKKINWAVVGWGLSLQFVFALFILKTSSGHWVFAKINTLVTGLLNFQEEGGKFVFGALSIPPGQANSLGFFFAFQVLPSVIFLSSLMSVFYYLGIMQWVISLIARLMKRAMKTSGAETLNAAANIFMGQTEAPLLVKPYLEKMTESELFCVMVAGMATISGGVMIAYVGLLKAYIPDIAGHLMAASVLSAIGSLVVSKLAFPETQTPETIGFVPIVSAGSDSNVLEAAASGAETGLKLALNVAAMLIAFMAILAMVNAGLHIIFGYFGRPDIGLEFILGRALSPVAWILGVPWKDCKTVGFLMGEKTILNEFVAYTDMSKILAGSAHALSVRSQIIAVYALCGFSNLLSIGIQIGGIGVLAPGRRKDLARLGVYALIAGSLTCFLSAAIAGLLI